MANLKNASTQTGEQHGPSKRTSVDDTASRVNVFTCASILECPICKEYAMAPIYQCANGHIMCSRCRTLITTCPTCLVKMGELIRNRQIEQIAEVLPFPCKYKNMGCSSLQSYRDLAEHEKYCNFRPVRCPHRRSCKWVGPLAHLMSHLGKGGRIKTFDGDLVKYPVACALDPSQFSEWRMIQCCFGESFMFVLLRDCNERTTLFYALVNILGSKKQAEKFTYSLELNSTNSTALVWKGTPIPYHDGVLAAVHRSKCLIFDIFSAKNFTKNGVLTFNVKITMKTQK